MTIKELKKEIKGVFKQPVKKYYFGKIRYGTPYFNPMNFNKHIISVRRLKERDEDSFNKYTKYKKWLRNTDQAKFGNLPMVRRSKDWIVKILNRYYWIQIGYPIMFKKINLGWKDKWSSPRYEWNPSFQVYFFNWQFCIFWNAPDGDNDQYYEQILWYLKYSGKDIEKARITWRWMNAETNESTWDSKYLKLKK